MGVCLTQRTNSDMHRLSEKLNITIPYIPVHLFNNIYYSLVLHIVLNDWIYH